MTVGITHKGGPTWSRTRSKKPCFVIAEMGAPSSPERRRSDQVLRFVIQPAAEACGYRAEWPPDISHPGTITHQVIERLLSALLVTPTSRIITERLLRARDPHAVRLPLVHPTGQTIPFTSRLSERSRSTFRTPTASRRPSKRAVKHIHAAEQDPSHVDNPLANAIDPRPCARSGKPSDAQLVQVVEAINQLREDVAQLRASVRPPFRPSRVLPGTGLQGLVSALPPVISPELMQALEKR